MKNAHKYKLDDTFKFGKYNGKTISYVLNKDWKYVLWCLKNVEGFTLDKEAQDFANKCFVNTQKEEKTTEGTEILCYFPFHDKQTAHKQIMSFLRAAAEDILVEKSSQKYIQLKLELV
jgi:hypothetical protein